MKKYVGVLVGILMMLVFVVSVNAEVIAQQIELQRYAYNLNRCDGDYYGQSFTTGANSTNLTSFTIKIGRYSSITTGYLIGVIKNSLTGSELAISTNAVNIADINYTSNQNVTYQDFTFNFNPYSLAPNTKYYALTKTVNYTTTCTDNLVTRGTDKWSNSRK